MEVWSASNVYLDLDFKVYINIFQGSGCRLRYIDEPYNCMKLISRLKGQPFQVLLPPNL